MKTPIYTLLLIMLGIYSYAQENIPDINGWKRQNSDNSTIFTPPGLFSGGFRYEVKSPASGAADQIEDFIKQSVNKEATASGLKEPTTEVLAKEIQSFTTVTTEAADASGKKWVLSIIGFPESDSTIRLAKIIAPYGVKSPYLNTAIKHFLTFAKEHGFTPGKGTASTRPKTSSTPAAKITTPLTAPGKGIAASELKGVVINMEYGTGVGGMLIIEYRPYLLLTDGSIYKYPNCSPYDLDVAQSRKTELNKWGTWKQEGKTLVVTLPEKTGTKTKRWEKNWFWTRPAQNDEKIKGSYKTISGGGNTALGGTSMIVLASNISFNDKGQFTFAKTGGGSSSDFGTSVSAYSNKKTAGTYQLNGYNIELHFNDGTVARKLFFFYPDSKDAFGLNDDVYTSANK